MSRTKENNSKRSLRERIGVVVDWIKRNKAVFVAMLLLMLCCGLMDSVVAVINKTLLKITDIERNLWTDWLFIVITVGVGVKIVVSWFKDNKIVSPRVVAILLVLLILYVYFRTTKDSPYSFVCYWNGPIAYLDGFALIGWAIVGAFVFQQFVKVDVCGGDAYRGEFALSHARAPRKIAAQLRCGKLMICGIYAVEISGPGMIVFIIPHKHCLPVEILGDPCHGVGVRPEQKAQLPYAFGDDISA